MKAWSKVIDSFHELPEAFKDNFPSYKEKFPYTVYSPARKYLSLNTNASIICLFDEKIYVLEKINNEVRKTGILFKDICYIENGQVLLNSWTEIVSRSARNKIWYNTVSEKLFQPIIEAIRAYLNNIQKESIDMDKQELDKFMENISLLYRNYTREKVMKGQKVLNVCYQPTIQIKAKKKDSFNYIISLFGSYLTSHSIVLTDTEVIIMEEEVKTQKGQKSSDGLIFTYIPLENITDLSVEDNLSYKDIVTLNIHLIQNNIIKVDFHVSNANLQVFKTQFNQLDSTKKRISTI
jgi:hypothetical protein